MRVFDRPLVRDPLVWIVGPVTVVFVGRGVDMDQPTTSEWLIHAGVFVFWCAFYGYLLTMVLGSVREFVRALRD